MRQQSYFGAGCFWGVEEAFRQLPGVIETNVGYQGGNPSPENQKVTYEQVCSGQTNHAEVVEVIFDSQRISYASLLQTFWNVHDPTQKNRQGTDVGTQYRSVIFAANEEQLRKAQTMKAQLEKQGRFNGPITTQILPYQPFYRAEEYHQQYYLKRGGGSCSL